MNKLNVWPCGIWGVIIIIIEDRSQLAMIACVVKWRREQTSDLEVRGSKPSKCEKEKPSHICALCKFVMGGVVRE